MSDEIPRMDIAEFRRVGFLQEANRLFFHPLGLALAVVIEADGSERLGGIWDYRDDPEGMLFGPGEIDAEKAASVEAERLKHAAERVRLEGCVIQPVDSPGTAT